MDCLFLFDFPKVTTTNEMNQFQSMAQSNFTLLQLRHFKNHINNINIKITSPLIYAENVTLSLTALTLNSTRCDAMRFAAVRFSLFWFGSVRFGSTYHLHEELEISSTC